MNSAMADDRRRRVRRSALLLLAITAAIYIAFIVMSVRRAHG